MRVGFAVLAGVCAVVFLCCVPAICLGQGVQTEPRKTAPSVDPTSRPSTVQLRGALIDEHGRPAVGIVVMVYEAPASQAPADLVLEVREGRTVNPKATTDQQGRFVIEVPRDFLGESQAFKLATGGVPASGLVRDAHGAVVRIGLDAKTKVLDLEQQLGKLRFW